MNGLNEMNRNILFRKVMYIGNYVCGYMIGKLEVAIRIRLRSHTVLLCSKLKDNLTWKVCGFLIQMYEIVWIA
jgi:hypothetical protein